MNQKLYDRMDWGRIEGLVYSEENQPHDFLGAFITDDGILVQAFFPTAAEVTVKTKGSSAKMELMDENGFFAVLLPGTKIPEYTLEVSYDDGRKVILSHYPVFFYNGQYSIQIPKKKIPSDDSKRSGRHVFCRMGSQCCPRQSRRGLQ